MMPATIRCDTHRRELFKQHRWERSFQGLSYHMRRSIFQFLATPLWQGLWC